MSTDNKDIQPARKELCVSLDGLCELARIEDREKYISTHDSLTFPLLMRNLTKYYLAKQDQLREGEYTSSEIKVALDCLANRLKTLDDQFTTELSAMGARCLGAIPVISDPEHGIKQVNNKAMKIIALSFALRDNGALDAFERAYDNLAAVNVFYAANVMANLDKTTPKVATRIANYAEEFARNSKYLSQFMPLEFEVTISRQPENVLLAVIDKAHDLSRQGQLLAHYVEQVRTILSYRDPSRALSALEKYRPK